MRIERPAPNSRKECAMAARHRSVPRFAFFGSGLRSNVHGVRLRFKGVFDMTHLVLSAQLNASEAVSAVRAHTKVVRPHECDRWSGVRKSTLEAWRRDYA